MSKHTPGPWHRDEEYPIYVWGPNQEMVADLPSCDEDAYVARMRGVGRGATQEEQDANCTLIAAAPDLLEALRAEVSECACRGTGTVNFQWSRGDAPGVPDSTTCHRLACEKSRAAIEKAEGL